MVLGLANENCSKGYENMVKDLSRAAASEKSSTSSIVKDQKLDTVDSKETVGERNNNNLVTPYRLEFLQD